MNLRNLFAVGVIAVAAGRVLGAEPFDEVVARASLEYNDRLKKATDELNQTRERVATEKAPLLKQLRAAEDRILAAQIATTRLETAKENASEQRRVLLKDLDAVRKNTSYISTLSRDSLKAAFEALAPGEDQFAGERFEALHQRFEAAVSAGASTASVEAVEFLVGRTQQALGGYTAQGSSMMADTNQVLKGTFAFVGPETFFRAENGKAGTVRPRSEAKYPITYPLAIWKTEESSAFFEGRVGAIPADVSGGKALRLQETQGTALEHISKGGVVAYAIVVVGLVALLMIIHKVRDVARMGVDTPESVQRFLQIVSQGEPAEARHALTQLKPMTKEVFSIGLQYREQPKIVLEEHLQAVLLRQRLHFERRLPLLAVIATAAPLMGLLGTVVGMVKTFALITVFGTGNAAKLSSGISEVLVATELGLTVAIPTLVAHGFLAHRIQKNLSLLERYALQFVTANDAARSEARTSEETLRT